MKTILNWCLVMLTQVIAKFRCVVRFIQVYPRDVRKLCDSNGKFKMLAILEDATARIQASLYADEGVKLLMIVEFMEDWLSNIFYICKSVDRKSFSGVINLMKRLWSRSWIGCWEARRWNKCQEILHGCNVACSHSTNTNWINGEAEDFGFLIHGSMLHETH